MVKVLMMMKDRDCFHVHTHRCGHAENVDDEEYIKKAIELDATGIWFTDHAPFPGDPFGNRMKFCDLEEYLSSITRLKMRYKGVVDVHVGLEIEYFPSFDSSGYYEQLCEDKRIEILLLGQHMAEIEKDKYTFSWDKERLAREEYIALGNAEIQGINSGYFKVVAHPDRIYRRRKWWTADMQDMAEQIVKAATENNVQLEINESSKKQKYHYWNEFWNCASSAQVIHGLDAHFIKELKIC